MSEGDILSALSSLKDKVDSIKNDMEFIRSKVEASDYTWVRKVYFDETIYEIKNSLSDIKSSCTK